MNAIQVFKPLNLFGLRTRKMLRYTESISLTGGALNTASAFVFSANGLFDPNISGTGHQPMGFDQMMALYDHYTVLRSRAFVFIENTTANPCRVSLSTSADTTVITAYQRLIENGQIVVASLTPVGIFGSNCRLTAKCDLKNFQGLEDTLDDPDMRGDTASNPTEQAYYHISAWDPNLAAAPIVLADVTIEFDVVFHEPRKLAQS